MTTYRIVCKKLSTDESHIEKVGLIKSGESPSSATSSATPKEINDMIGNGHTCFITNEAGAEAEVDKFDGNFIRTKPDGIIRNNLRHLRNCNFS